MFEEAINYPRKGEKNWTTVAVGGILSLLSFLFAPVFLVLGYGARVLRHAAADPESETAPVFDEWGDLFVDGLKQFGVAFVYLLVPGVVFGVSVGGAISGTVSATGLGALVAPFVTFYATVSAYYLYGGAVGVIDPDADEGSPESTAGQPTA
ncbi:MAG: DUF4013 domain-containing protein [Haloglomus sp.]